MSLLQEIIIKNEAEGGLKPKNHKSLKIRKTNKVFKGT